ncbi:hypothetical protein AMC87_CH04264 [Rhizobium phaseoli]|nr:hypothetical protein AMC87_CH04264 [Rhizobium phaseoli]EGE58763.1 hypothetical protein RHECNPAF_280062 [Rhizobium etli CNPAF512]
MIGFAYCSICGMTHAQNHHESKTNPYAVSVTYQRFERRVPQIARKKSLLLTDGTRVKSPDGCYRLNRA